MFEGLTVEDDAAFCICADLPKLQHELSQWTEQLFQAAFRYRVALRLDVFKSLQIPLQLLTQGCQVSVAPLRQHPILQQLGNVREDKVTQWSLHELAHRMPMRLQLI